MVLLLVRRRGPCSLPKLLLLPPLLLLCWLLVRNICLLFSLHRAWPLDDDVLLSKGAYSSRWSDLPAEAWAGFPPPEVAAGAAEVVALLSEQEGRELEALCGRCLFEQLKMVVGYGNGHKVFVTTGDIHDMWIRDSAVQLGVLLPRMRQRPALRLLVEGAVRTQAFFIVQDPYANGYYLKWRHPTDQRKEERIVGRGGWVATRNYELDSGAYFLHMLWNLHSLPGYGRDALLAEPVVYEAASLLVDVWTTEQHHEERSSYRYSELPRNGMGPPSNYTGMSWCGYRPSDDIQTYGYNVPVNMYAQAAVERALELNKLVWHSAEFEKKASALVASMREGIEQWGIAEVDGQRVYAYEVDGLGNQLLDFDDANVPSLLSIPLLGYRHFDAAIYEATRARILSPKNPWYFESDKLRGIGSPHTPPGSVWPLGLVVQGLTSHDPKERADLLRTLLLLQCGNGLMHESVSVEDLSQCTRPWFGWANAMLVTLVEAAMGVDCAVPAERMRLARIKEREARDASAAPQNGGKDHELYYETLEDTIMFDVEVLKPPRRLE